MVSTSRVMPKIFCTKVSGEGQDKVMTTKSTQSEGE